jgi:hypothetical protein
MQLAKCQTKYNGNKALPRSDRNLRRYINMTGTLFVEWRLGVQILETAEFFGAVHRHAWVIFYNCVQIGTFGKLNQTHILERTN